MRSRRRIASYLLPWGKRPAPAFEAQASCTLPGLGKPFAVPTPDIVPDGGQFLARSYSNHAGNRAYKLYIPSSYHGQALPLIIMLHGCTQSPDDFKYLEVLELVSPERPAAWPWRTFADRGHHRPNHARLLGRPTTHLYRRPVGRRRGRRYYGDDLPRSLRRGGCAFRPRLRHRERSSVRVRRQAPGRRRHAHG